MAVPKRKTSKSRRDKRRASNYKAVKPNIMECPQCHEPKLPHRVCSACGFYKNKEVKEVK
ncbi:50S ribosomal protein L32 [Clostridium sp. D2Q-11]|uniref:Large ribosomal subunit protein bL32 n=1 Tax=Anaeromonas frigoriresistens TaxID=2683708 RepID=A0A942V242_9FIRM|nr:50S ribosomal protein L32 [Anaeromonas frigoriresistens]MBS4539757.1 50S ribosomal protein L32 [Anaeromonas frigoriresistens]